MPFTFNGCGTRFYGERDRAEDGSYITTEWITFVYIPLLPIRSYRVLPVGQGTNIVIHRSQEYRTLRVPLCWPQIRNVYCFSGPIILLVMYLSLPDVQKWFDEKVSKSATSQIQLEPQTTQLAEADLPLDSKAAATACGKVLKLGDESTFVKLDLVRRLSAIVDDSGYTNYEFDSMGSRKMNSEEAFKAYSFAYLTWDKSTTNSRGSFDKMIVDSAHSQKFTDLSSSERVALDAWTVKFKRMMLKAFDLGRHDARTSPCPF